MDAKKFQEIIWHKGRELYRSMPWREDTNAYFVLVSELMLQQTQVDRVIPKFKAFIEQYPDVAMLARASLADVLSLWNGLGYNRRAKYLHEAAKYITDKLNGEFPEAKNELMQLPGVGPNTAGAILAYSFNQPAIFIETNIRTVLFHHFFENAEVVDDVELKRLLEEVLDRDHPREFYWALMDYGTWLKRNGLGRIQQSRQYKKQSPLKGSVREVRGEIVRLLMEKDRPLFELEIGFKGDERFERAVDGLLYDGLIQNTAGNLHLTK